VWSEWEMRGTRRDGQPHLLRGVVIFGVEGDQATWARFYLEPVERGGVDAEEAIQMTLTRNTPQGGGESAPPIEGPTAAPLLSHGHSDISGMRS
jgi:hypothetical protein